MKIERTKNARRGIVAGILLRICQTVLPFLMRTAMIHIMGVQYLGINSLFSSILHILNLAELGVGSAMVFSMYTAIAQDDEETICALMCLYRKYYRIIGLVVGAAGLALVPVLPLLISGEIPDGLNIYVLYLLNLGSTVLSYWLFAYRNCLLQAYQRSDLISWIAIITCFVQYGIQFAVLPIFKNYYLYVTVILGTQILNNVLTAAVTKKIYPQYKPKGKLSELEIRKINQKVRDIFTGKIGHMVLKSSDTIIISAALGLKTLAVYQNYYFLITAVTNTLEIVLSSILAGLGNSFITETKEKNYKDLEKFTFLLLWLNGVCTCCFLGMYQPFMKIWVGEELMLEFGLVICFAIYFFVYVLNRLLNVYKDAAGLWHEDRMRPLVKAALNVVLNIIWIRNWGLYGVLLSTIVAIAVVGFPWILRNLFTLFFDRHLLKGYCREILSFVFSTIFSGFVVCMLCAQIHLENTWITFLICAVISVLAPCILFFLLFRKHRLFGPSVQFMDRLTKKKFKLEKWLLSK